MKRVLTPLTAAIVAFLIVAGGFVYAWHVYHQHPTHTTVIVKPAHVRHHALPTGGPPGTSGHGGTGKGNPTPPTNPKPPKPRPAPKPPVKVCLLSTCVSTPKLP